MIRTERTSRRGVLARMLRSRLLRWVGVVLATVLLPLLAYLSVVAYLYLTYLRPDTTLPVSTGIGETVVLDRTYEAPAARADSLLSRALGEASLPSISAAVGRDGDLLWAAARGLAEIETNRPANLRSRYRLGSVSKPLTGTLLARLVDQGRLDLDGPIGDYVGDLPEHLKPITARQLASHRAGIRHYKPFAFSWPPTEGLSDEHYARVSDAIEVFKDDALLFEPGTDFRYSTYGYVLLSRVLEVVGGADFLSLMKDEVLTPLFMQDTSGDDATREIPDRVAFYETGDGKYTRSYPVDASVKWAGGGFVGSPSDLVRLGLALFGDDFLDGQTRETMFTAQALADGSMNPQNYGLGWRIDVSESLEIDGDMARIIHHGGIQTGGSAILVLLPDHDLAVAVMTNSGARAGRSTVQSVAYDLARIFVDDQAAGRW